MGDIRRCDAPARRGPRRCAIGVAGDARGRLGRARSRPGCPMGGARRCVGPRLGWAEELPQEFHD